MHNHQGNHSCDSCARNSIADYESSTGTMTVWNVKDENGKDYPGLVVKLTHVAPSSTSSMVKG